MTWGEHRLAVLLDSIDRYGLELVFPRRGKGGAAAQKLSEWKIGERWLRTLEEKMAENPASSNHVWA